MGLETHDFYVAKVIGLVDVIRPRPFVQVSSVRESAESALHTPRDRFRCQSVAKFGVVA